MKCILKSIPHKSGLTLRIFCDLPYIYIMQRSCIKIHFSKFALLSVLYDKNAIVKSANFNVKNANDKSANFQ